MGKTAKWVKARRHQAIIAQVLTPIYETQFSDSSYGFRPNRDCHMAIKKSHEYINDGYKYVVDMDLEKFFDKVNHDKLMQILNNTIKDGNVLLIIRKFLVSWVMVNGVLIDTLEGTPQGGALSPLLSNIILLLDYMIVIVSYNFFIILSIFNFLIGNKWLVIVLIRQTDFSKM